MKMTMFSKKKIQTLIKQNDIMQYQIVANVTFFLLHLELWKRLNILKK